MSSITTDQGILHYEVLGRGKPVILLHGWLGSWGLWQDTMTFLSRSFRTYAMDFWGFGESGKKRSTYHVNDFVSMVDQFMDQLGIQRAPLVGHSMGGTVSLMTAIRYPQRVERVGVIGSPIVGSSLSWLLKAFSLRPVAYLVYHNLWLMRLGFHVLAPLYSRHPDWPQMMSRDLSQITLDSFLLSIASLRKTDLRPDLPKVRIPVLGMYGDRDLVVDPMQRELLRSGVPHSRIERFPSAGHFIMLDEPEAFRKCLMEFLAEGGDESE